MQNEEGHFAALSSCSRASENDRAELSDGLAQHRASTAALSMTSSLDALRTWMQHGRGHIPVPLLHNEGNRCYRNAAISALVICYHHTKALACRWGCVHDIVEAARLEWHGLSAVTSFRSSEENWPEPWLQHDVCEYLVHLTRCIPLLQPVAAEARFMTEAGVVKEDCLCILDLPRSGLTLQECFRHWQISSGVVKGLLVAPPVLCIPLERFVYDNRLLRRQHATVQLEPSELELPVFADALGIDCMLVRYRCVACVRVCHRAADTTELWLIVTEDMSLLMMIGLENSGQILCILIFRKYMFSALSASRV